MNKKSEDMDSGLPKSEKRRRQRELRWETQVSGILCDYKEGRIGSDIQFLHCHDGYEVLLMEYGEVVMQFMDFSVPITRGDILVIPPYVFHFAMQNNQLDYRRYVINFSETALASLICRDPRCSNITDCFYHADNYRLHVSEQELDRLSSMAFNLDAATKEDPSVFESEVLRSSLLTVFLIRLNRVALVSSDSAPVRKPDPDCALPQVIQDVLHYIDQHYADMLYVNEIAESVHLNAIYLNRIFKRYTGVPLQQYIIDRRLAQAQKMLRDGISPMDVCFACGFRNYSNFSRTFTNHVKVSPKQYQKSARTTFEVV